jgi:superfamily II DNA or RNA helicase
MIPFKECIVDANPKAIQMPDYLKDIYELDYIIDKKVKAYTLDHYQEKAFRTAFSTNISLIQGPPGTGKTYIGEKIA